MPAKPRRNLTPIMVAAAAGAGLWLWSRQANAAQAVDPRWLAQQELARRQALGSPTAATDTLGMILKIGGSAATLGTTVYGTLKKVFDFGTNADATTALTKWISGGPTELTTGIDPAMSTSDMIRTWQAAPPTAPGGAPTSPVSGDTLLQITETPVLQDATAVLPSEVPTYEPPIPVAESPLPPTDLSLPPIADAGLTIPSFELTLPGSVFDPASLEGATGAVLLQQDGLVRLSLTADEVEQASNIVALWESGQLDLSLLPADKAAFLSDNLPTLKAFTESGDFGVGQFSSPISGDTIMRVMPSEVPTGLITEPGASGAGMLQELLATPLWETSAEAASGAALVGEATTVTTLGDVLSVVGPVVTIVVACVSMYFTITGNLPDYQKAIYCALDAASIAAVFIPVVGWIVAAVIQIVKFVLQKVLGQAKSHEQREAEETAYLLQYGAHEMSKQIAQVMTLRQLHSVLTSWGSGSTGGTSSIAIVTSVDVAGVRKLIGGASTIYPVASINDMVGAVDSLVVSIQGGVAPEFLQQANTSLRNLIQAMIPIMVNARGGDFDATNWLVSRALALYIPAPHPQMRFAPSILRLQQMFASEYPWWSEVVLQTAYTLQANVWHHATWLDMVNHGISQVAGATQIQSWTPSQLTSFAKVYGFTDFRAWRAAFFSFEEPVSLAYLEGAGGMDKVYELQKQIELLANAMVGAKSPVTDYDDLANLLHAQAEYASVVSAVYVPDYSITEAWTAQLGPTVTVGYWRLPTAPGWEEYVGGTYQSRSLDQVKALLQTGAMPMIYHRPLTQWLTIVDPNDPSRRVPNPVFLIPNSVAYI